MSLNHTDVDQARHEIRGGAVKMLVGMTIFAIACVGETYLQNNFITGMQVLVNAPVAYSLISFLAFLGYSYIQKGFTQGFVKLYARDEPWLTRWIHVILSFGQIAFFVEVSVRAVLSYMIWNTGKSTPFTPSIGIGVDLPNSLFLAFIHLAFLLSLVALRRARKLRMEACWSGGMWIIFSLLGVAILSMFGIQLPVFPERSLLLVLFPYVPLTIWLRRSGWRRWVL